MEKILLLGVLLCLAVGAHSQSLDEGESADSREALRLMREANLRRIAELAGGRPPSAAPVSFSAAYAQQVVQRVRPNIVFGDEVDSNPAATVEVVNAPDGTILQVRLIEGSGHSNWDAAVVKALERTAVMPRDVDGRVPQRMRIVFRPK